MGQGVTTILTFAVAVAISPVPIIAVILMLFSRRARVNGPVFLLGWVVALAVVSAVAFLLAEGTDADTSSTTSATVAWGKVLFGLGFLALAARSWRSRPMPGEEPRLPAWMAGIDGLAPLKALGLGLLLAGVNPKNLLLSVAAGSSVAVLGLSTGAAVGSLVVFVVVASLSIGAPVAYHLVGGASAQARLDATKAGWPCTTMP